MVRSEVNQLTEDLAGVHAGGNTIVPIGDRRVGADWAKLCTNPVVAGAITGAQMQVSATVMPRSMN